MLHQQQAPLYINNTVRDLFSQDKIGYIPNINKNLFDILNSYLQINNSPEKFLFYIYGIFFSRIYREKYIDFLYIDFPRVPFTADKEIYFQISTYGERLARLHLLESKELESPGVKYQGTGENDTIDKVAFDAERQRVYVNASKYFEGVTAEMWAYQIGGYQVLSKWLKDRKGRRLDDPRTYCRIATAIAKTMEIQEQIDEIYPEVEKNVINFKE